MAELLADPKCRRIAAKRVADIAAIVAFSSLLVVVSGATAGLAVAFMGRPVIFNQKRIGLAEKPFTLYKFRSMLPEVDGQGNALQPAERLTPFGKFSRRSSLDEVPQL